mmetsp:Transcript_11126/g.22233  ORF Transcript_11126/g.22233 Transcript_11126/m.22233 type:complete len:508 (-) Transcript_11126:140-1663(-)
MVVVKRHQHAYDESPAHRSIHIGSPLGQHSPSFGKHHHFHHHRDDNRPFWKRGSVQRVLLVVLLGGVGMVVWSSFRLHHVLTCRWHRSSRKSRADSEGFSRPFEPYQPQFLGVNELRRRDNECARLLGFPQIALLFLVHGQLPNEKIWYQWFQMMRDRIPVSESVLGRCEGNSRGDLVAREVLAKACVHDDASQDDVIGLQHGFDVWVHLPKGMDDDIFERSIFKQSLIPERYRVEATWGGHSLIDATRVLFAAALTNPLVSKLVLISDSDVPLYGPLVFYKQLVSESQSRINACNTTAGWDTNNYRLRQDLIEAGITETIWRKSWQWIALTRGHARIVLDDRKIDDIFRHLCRPRWDDDWCDFRVCYSDEHYIPTLLAIQGLDNETDCRGELTDRDWSRVKVTDPHPYEYKPADISTDLFMKLRHAEIESCERSSMIQMTVGEQFRNISKVVGSKKSKTVALCGSLNQNPTPSYVPLGSVCPLLARKFSNSTHDLVESVLSKMLIH